MRALLTLTLVVLAFSASAQQVTLPSDADLKSAYCLRVIQHQLQSFDSLPAEALNTDETLSKFIATRRDDLKRLQSYLLPKMFSIDPTGLMAARNRAEADVKENDKQVPICMDKCHAVVENGILGEKWVRCMTACEVEIGAIARVMACQKIDWLPF